VGKVNYELRIISRIADRGSRCFVASAPRNDKSVQDGEFADESSPFAQFGVPEGEGFGGGGVEVVAEAHPASLGCSGSS